MTPFDREGLRAHLLETRVAGPTRTSRASVVGNAERLSAGDPDKMLGLGPVALSPEEILAAVADLCGCSADIDGREGDGWIDPDLTLDALAAAAGRLGDASRRGERVLLATGHPSALLPVYERVALALGEGGAKLLQPADDVMLAGAPLRIRWIGSVAVLSDGVSLLHTHKGEPMERVFEEIDLPDLVVADHGYAGAAVAREIETIAFTDVNDPALAVAWAAGRVSVAVPLDDNVPPHLYEPLTTVLERAARCR